MKLSRVNNTSATVVQVGEREFLFSYQTLVGYFEPGAGYFRTEKKWSNTTSKHINKWLGGVKAKEVSQEYLDSLQAQITFECTQNTSV